MTQEEIEQKALEVYPFNRNIYFGGDNNEDKRGGYIKALTEIKSLPKIKGWVARDGEGYLTICGTLPKRAKNDEGNLIWDAFSSLDVDTNIFPDLKPEDGPIEVELIIRKV